jgi:hypothetical protein
MQQSVRIGAADSAFGIASEFDRSALPPGAPARQNCSALRRSVLTSRPARGARFGQSVCAPDVRSGGIRVDAAAGGPPPSDDIVASLREAWAEVAGHGPPTRRVDVR